LLREIIAIEIAVYSYSILPKLSGEGQANKLR